jgi:ubiquitin carboxyl-terminal hydrolase 10
MRGRATRAVDRRLTRQILQVLTYCPPFTALLEALSTRLKADLARKTPLLEAMIVFLQEFQPASASVGASAGAAVGSASVSGTSTPTPGVGASNGTATPRGAGRAIGRAARERDAFVPENVYDAMKENKRFDSMRVSGARAWAWAWGEMDGTKSARG